MNVDLRHTGNGVVVVGKSGINYKAEHGEVVSFLEIDAEDLTTNHPEWESTDGDQAEEEE